jgi:hypothetical protein
VTRIYLRCFTNALFADSLAASVVRDWIALAISVFVVIVVEQVVYCSIPFALLLLYAAVSPLSHSPCHAPYAPDSTIMRYHAPI